MAELWKRPTKWVNSLFNSLRSLLLHPLEMMVWSHATTIGNNWEFVVGDRLDRCCSFITSIHLLIWKPKTETFNNTICTIRLKSRVRLNPKSSNCPLQGLTELVACVLEVKWPFSYLPFYRETWSHYKPGTSQLRVVHLQPLDHQASSWLCIFTEPQRVKMLLAGGVQHLSLQLFLRGCC